MTDPFSTPRQIAFYYPGPVWHTGDRIKNLLPFFDGIGLLVPRHLQHKPEDVEPHIAIPLRENGMLINIEPEEHLDATATATLGEFLRNILDSGALDSLASDSTAAFHSLSRSRLGYSGDPRIAEDLYQKLLQKGLAKKVTHDESIPMHHQVRLIILVLLAQILKSRGSRMGLELIPTTDRADLLNSLAEILSLPVSPSAGHVISKDLETVGVDLAPFPMDEILHFREEYGAQFRSYMRGVKRFVWDLSQMEADERVEATIIRVEELKDLASEVRRSGESSWKTPASVALGAAGAIWTVTTGDIVGGLFALGGAALGIKAGNPDSVAGAYSYLFCLPSEQY